MPAGVSVRSALLIAAAALCGACGVDPFAPPPVGLAPSPFIAQVGGQWTGPSSLVSVTGVLGSGSECVGGDLVQRLNASALPADTVTLSLTQDSASVSGRVTTSSSGLACSYTGSAALSSMALNAAECEAPPLVIRCDDDRVRDLQLTGSHVVGSVTAGVMTGTVTNTYKVIASGGDSVASLVLGYSYSASRR